MSGLLSRVARLEKGQRCRCAAGLRKVVALVTVQPGEAPGVPNDLEPGCPVCGGGRLVLIEELVAVDSGEGAGA